MARKLAQLLPLKWLQSVILASVSQRCAFYWSVHKEGNTLSLSSSIVKLSSDCSRDPRGNLFLASNISSHHWKARFCSIGLVTVNRSQMVISCFWMELKTMSACPGACQISLFAASISLQIFLKTIFRIQLLLIVPLFTTILTAEISFLPSLHSIQNSVVASFLTCFPNHKFFLPPTLQFTQ